MINSAHDLGLTGDFNLLIVVFDIVQRYSGFGQPVIRVVLCQPQTLDLRFADQHTLDGAFIDEHFAMANDGSYMSRYMRTFPSL